MDTLQQPERALVTLLLLLTMVLIVMIVIRRSRCMVQVLAIMIQHAVLVLLIFGAIVPVLAAGLGARSAG